MVKRTGPPALAPVALKGTLTTDGEHQFRRRTVICTMDPNEVTQAPTLQAAIAAFVKCVSYLDEVREFEQFTITGKVYTEEHWQ